MSESQDTDKISAEPADGNPEKAPKTEPASQALLDLEASGLTPEDLSAAARAAAEAEKKIRSAPPTADLPGFRWLVLLLLSAAGGLALAWSAKEPPNFPLWGLAGLILLLLLMSALPPSRLWPRLPTRGGLAAALFAIAIFIRTLMGPPEAFFSCPAALAWAGLLTLALLWTAVAVLRKLWSCRPLAVLAGLVLLHAALGPIPALVKHFSPYGPDLTWATLNASPVFLTGPLPWFLWPMTFTLGLALPLAALLALGDQFSSLRRPGARHGGNFFLALAWLGLMPSGLLLFPPALDNYPDLAQKIRETAPIPAAMLAPEAETLPEPALAAEPTETPPAAAPDDKAQTAAAAPPPASNDASASPSAAAEAPRSAAPPDSLEAQLEELQDRNENLQLKIDELESRLQLFSDRLNQLERPEQTQNLTPPLPPELEAPDRPLPAPPEKNENKNGYSGGSAT